MAPKGDAVLASCYTIDGVPLVRPVELSDYSEPQPCILLDLSARIGLPLHFSSVKPDRRIQYTGSDTHIVEAPNNAILHMLSLEQQPDGLMVFSEVTGTPRPDILIARADGQALQTKIVLLMWRFVSDTLKIAGAEHLLDDERQVKFFGEMTPGKFVEWWNTYDGADGECPVKL